MADIGVGFLGLHEAQFRTIWRDFMQ